MTETSTALTAIDPHGINLGKVLLLNDYSPVPEDQRMELYRRICEALELNNLTQPFVFIKTRQGTKLYATKDATNQLRSKRNVSIKVTARELDQDGIFNVYVTASIGDRVEDASASLFVDGLEGQDLADAKMKCETKAKRRATLDICGLGLALDDDARDYDDDRGRTTVTVEPPEDFEMPTANDEAPPPPREAQELGQFTVEEALGLDEPPATPPKMTLKQMREARAAEGPPPAPKTTQRPANPPRAQIPKDNTGRNWSNFWAVYKRDAGFSEEYIHKLAGTIAGGTVESLVTLTDADFARLTKALDRLANGEELGQV